MVDIADEYTDTTRNEMSNTAGVCGGEWVHAWVVRTCIWVCIWCS